MPSLRIKIKISTPMETLLSIKDKAIAVAPRDKEVFHQK